ncbi:MAG: acyltransferase [Bacteroidia bacterium]|nr:acyltransferase [Bacteroidia bacterium]
MIKLMFLLTRFSRYARLSLSTPLSYLILVMSGVKIGKKNLFDGVIRIVNQSGRKSIIIGEKCRFNSSSRSNMIGINRPCIISTHLPNSKISIGNNCGFSGTVIGCFKEIYLGNNVRCGANTLITDSDWHLNDPRSGIPKAVRIEDNVWLGVNSVVLKGVTIGTNSVIGANSVVVKDIPANVIAAGNPCKIIKYL